MKLQVKRISGLHVHKDDLPLHLFSNDTFSLMILMIIWDNYMTSKSSLGT